jgi:hypothetical protein
MAGSERVNTVPFSVKAENFCWIQGIEDDPEDLCAHATVTVQIGDETLQDGCCVSASAMRMLRTLTEDHLVEDRDHGQQMIPCCGHSMFPEDNLESVYISGCYYGIDYEVRHQDDIALITIENGDQYAVSFEDYRQEVLRFARQVEAYYNQCSPKILPDENLFRNGYIAFWNEWKRRMAREEGYL